MKTRRVVLTESLLFFHEDQRFPQTFAEYTKKRRTKREQIWTFFVAICGEILEIFCASAHHWHVSAFCVIGNSSEFPITQKKTWKRFLSSRSQYVHKL